MTTIVISLISLQILLVEENTESIENALHEAAKRGNITFLNECLGNKVSFLMSLLLFFLHIYEPTNNNFNKNTIIKFKSIMQSFSKLTVTS